MNMRGGRFRLSGVLAAAFLTALLLAGCGAVREIPQTEDSGEGVNPFANIGGSPNPFTGKKTIALVDNGELFAQAAAEYQAVLEESELITDTEEAALVERVGTRIREAAEAWADALGESEYLADYAWEYALIESDEVNAWCMPGGKIAVYTGILDVTGGEAGLAVVMAHETAHALLNHSQQRMSADIIKGLGAIVVELATWKKDRASREIARAAYGAGSTLLGTLPFSRAHESEADRTGLLLMTLAGYDPEGAPVFWERMAARAEASDGALPEFLSTHPSDATRIRQLQDWIPEARERAEAPGP